MESPHAHTQTSHRKPARFLVVIDSGGYVVARLFLDTREQVAEFDAALRAETLPTRPLAAVVRFVQGICVSCV